MSTLRRGAWVAAAMLAAGLAQAQTASPPDPLAPGAAAETAKPENATAPVAEKAAKPEPEKARREKAKPSHREAGSLAVTVHNERLVGLMTLSVVPAGDPDHTKALGALAFGRKTVIHIKRAKDCLYDIRGHFADEADTEQLGVDLCKDKAINLTD